MAFFNLWSSERLSFSLSIIAVVSAAITTYHQFHEEIDIAFQVGMPQSAPSYGCDSFDSLLILNEDTLTIPFTFVNSGTTPVGYFIVHDGIYVDPVATDSTHDIMKRLAKEQFGAEDLFSLECSGRTNHDAD
jgi:hypothetical protein